MSHRNGGKDEWKNRGMENAGSACFKHIMKNKGIIGSTCMGYE
jgi:hypothetical protein